MLIYKLICFLANNYSFYAMHNHQYTRIKCARKSLRIKKKMSVTSAVCYDVAKFRYIMEEAHRIEELFPKEHISGYLRRAQRKQMTTPKAMKMYSLSWPSWKNSHWKA
ncbi:hypothetical protein NERG_00566 [Nematocida ausubeli]|uniref:Uncharacterized protein n=1 Tax=Nematocida ausubeli (strain ATCC PRA-371 / ERTm2) TaxID=1913371 RepID=H8ZAE5_NEMA1|nr:hypothetical protein NERG_00566 [Nematocida ausubeli]